MNPPYDFSEYPMWAPGTTRGWMRDEYNSNVLGYYDPATAWVFVVRILKTGESEQWDDTRYFVPIEGLDDLSLEEKMRALEVIVKLEGVPKK
jgi:hypothetical protein